MSFARKLVKNYGKTLIDTAIKTAIDAAKNTSKGIVQKPRKATRDLIGNKIAEKITSIGKSEKETKKKNKIKLYSTRKKAKKN